MVSIPCLSRPNSAALLIEPGFRKLFLRVFAGAALLGRERQGMDTMPSRLESWTPSAEQIERANLTAFLRASGVRDYHALLDEVKADVPGFYERIVRPLDLRWDLSLIH